MTFLRKNPERIQATHDFCAFFQSKGDPLSTVLAEIAPREDQLGWAIAGEALHQSLSLGQLADLIAAFAQEFPQGRLWALPALKVAEVQRIMAARPWLRGWPLDVHAPGILNSVGHWVRNHGGTPEAALRNKSTAELWKDLGEIYYMGKGSATRPKALSLIWRLQADSPVGLGFPLRARPLASGNPWPMPVSPGARRWLKYLGPNPQKWMEGRSEAEKLRYFQRMYGALWQSRPDLVAHGLSFFLEPGGSDLLCRVLQDGCRNCPLASMSILSGACPQRRV